MRVLLLSILAHLIADFVLQSDKMVSLKALGYIKGYLLHGLMVFATLIILLHTYKFGTVILYSFGISALHIGIDYLKCRFCLFKKGVFDLFAFIIDQTLHLIIIFIFWQAATINTDNIIVSFYKHHVFSKLISIVSKGSFQYKLMTMNEFIVYLIVYLYVLYGGAIFTRKYLDIYFPDGPPIITRINGLKNVGKHIGILERIIILTLVITNNYSAIAFVFAAKSIARFKEIENNKNFGEYYLLGTLLSCVTAILGGFVLKFIINIA